MSRPGAVVLGAGYRALAVVRSLARNGVEVCVVRNDEHAVALSSRYPSRRVSVPSGHREALMARLQALALQEGLAGWVLIPTDDDDVEFLSANHDQLSRHFVLSVPARGAVAWALDKRDSYALAAEHGIAVPRMWPAADLAALQNPEITYPAVLKPAFRPHHLATSTPKAWRAESPDELKTAYRVATAVMPAERLLIQELVAGGGENQLAYAALCREGTVLASLATRRLRQWPPEFGMASTHVETIDERELGELAAPLLAASRFSGIVELEFKRDPRDGAVKLLDVNPRAWGWISVGSAAGVDFPFLLWRLLLGGEVPRLRGRPGVRWVRMSTDVLAARSLIGKELSARQYLRSLRPPLTGAIFAADDPLPALLDVPLLASIMVGRRLRRPTPARGRPRALIIVENAPVPGDRRVWNEALSLTSGGWEVTVLAPHAEQGPPRPSDELTERVHLRRFPLRDAGESRLGHLREYTEATWRIWREVRALAGERPFDVIQACNPPDFVLVAALGQRLRRGTRLIFDHHDLAPEMYACRSGAPNALVSRALLALERLAFRLADVTLATNDSVRRIALERNHKLPQDVFTVRNGPRLQSFTPVPRDPGLARGKEHLLLYVGMMAPQDGVDHALRALSHLAARRQDWHALFLGDGEMLPGLRRLASELGLGDSVEFAGFVSDNEVRRAICSADVCIAPDPRNRYTDSSTLVKIAEYMALSRPIVCYELLESKVTAAGAALFASGNEPAELARLIEELLADPELRRRLGAEGRARVESELAWEHSEPVLLAAYRRAVGGRIPEQVPAKLKAPVPAGSPRA